LLFISNKLDIYIPFILIQIGFSQILPAGANILAAKVRLLIGWGKCVPTFRVPRSTFRVPRSTFRVLGLKSLKGLKSSVKQRPFDEIKELKKFVVCD